jgi:hypothetical protein
MTIEQKVAFKKAACDVLIKFAGMILIEIGREIVKTTQTTLIAEKQEALEEKTLKTYHEINGPVFTGTITTCTSSASKE